MTFDLVQTMALAAAALVVGHGVRRLIPWLGRMNVPAPVLGGLLVALYVLGARDTALPVPTFDTTLQKPLLLAFFTTLGFAASLARLREGGPLVLRFLGLALVFAVLQNLLGMGLAVAFGLPPLFGVLTGAVALAGGPATTLAFAPQFEAAGVAGAAAVGLSAAMAGIVLGGMLGGPIATRLLHRQSRASSLPQAGALPQASPLPQDELGCREQARSHNDLPVGASLLAIVTLLIVMGLGSWVSTLIASTGITLPAYIGGMLVAALVRNWDDATGWVRLPHELIDQIGTVCLALFLALALMTLDLAQLAGLGLPLLVMLTAQALLVAAASLWVVWRVMGRDYDAAVMAGGFTGFMLGTSANAMAVMHALVARHGPAPRAFLVAPLVGAFFIDFTNALVITGFLNWLAP